MGISVNVSMTPPAAEVESRNTGKTTEDAAAAGGFEALFAALVAPASVTVDATTDTANTASVTDTAVPLQDNSPAADLPGLAMGSEELDADFLLRVSEQRLQDIGKEIEDPADSTLADVLRADQAPGMLPSEAIAAIPLSSGAPVSPTATSTLVESLRTSRPGNDSAGTDAAPLATTTADASDRADVPAATRAPRNDPAALHAPIEEMPVVAMAKPMPDALERQGGTSMAAIGDAMPPQGMASHANTPLQMAREIEIKLPPSNPVWREAFTSQVNLLIGERVQAAEMRVHPPELGPVDIRISVADQQTSIAFTAAHEDTRRAIEDALPRLREVLEESGVQLGKTSVEGERTQHEDQGNRSTAPGRHLPENHDNDDADTGAIARTASIRAPLGLIDTFA
jgi:flagellar hook-length control protein FliK